MLATASRSVRYHHMYSTFFSRALERASIPAGAPFITARASPPTFDIFDASLSRVSQFPASISLQLRYTKLELNSWGSARYRDFPIDC
jgi:hypothetical protein